MSHERNVVSDADRGRVRDTVSVHMAGTQFLVPKGCPATAHVMFDELAWWAGALREARARRPYGVGRREAAA